MVIGDYQDTERKRVTPRMFRNNFKGESSEDLNHSESHLKGIDESQINSRYCENRVWIYRISYICIMVGAWGMKNENNIY